MRIYAVIFPIEYHQPEIESLWLNESDADKECAELNEQFNTDMYRVEPMEVND